MEGNWQARMARSMSFTSNGLRHMSKRTWRRRKLAADDAKSSGFWPMVSLTNQPNRPNLLKNSWPTSTGGILGSGQVQPKYFGPIMLAIRLAYVA